MEQSSTPDIRIVLTSVERSQDAEKIAREIVEAGLAACVNILGSIRSVYRWKGSVETASEYLLLIKTTADRRAQLSAALKRLHPYELPEQLELQVNAGSSEYLAWIASSVRHEFEGRG